MVTAVNYLEVINELKQQIFTGDHQAIYTMACALACMTASFALVLWYNHWRTDPWGMFDLKTLIRILGTLIVVCNFHTLVLMPLDSMTSLFTKGINASVTTDPASMQTKLNNAYASVENAVKNNTMRGVFEQYLESDSNVTTLEDGVSGGSNSVLESTVEQSIAQGEEPGFWEKAWDTAKSAMGFVSGFTYSAVSNVLSWLLSAAVDVVRFVMNIVCGIYLIILGILGPFIFALGILPAFQHNITSWIGRYIQFSLWVPVCTLVDYINIHLKDALLTAFEKYNLVEQMVFPTIFIILLDIATLILLLSVPSICSWVASGDSVNAARSGVSTAQKAMKLLVK